MTERSNLTGNITNWHDSRTGEERKAAQRGIKTAQNIAGAHPQSVGDVSDVRCLRGAQSSQRQHPAHPTTACSLQRRLDSDTETSAAAAAAAAAPSRLQLLCSSGSQALSTCKKKLPLLWHDYLLTSLIFVFVCVAGGTTAGVESCTS